MSINDKQIAINTLAIVLHNSWTVFSGREPNWKVVDIKNRSDFLSVLKILKAFQWSFIRLNERKFEIDIQNLEFHFLTIKWQNENRLAAKAAIEFVLDFTGHDIDYIASLVYDAWLSRNHSETIRWKRVPYAELSLFEKSKNQMHVVFARQAIDFFHLVKE